jgi:hypothetical protein
MEAELEGAGSKYYAASRFGVGNPNVVVWADSSVATQLLRGPTCNPLAGKGLDASHNAGMSLD